MINPSVGTNACKLNLPPPSDDLITAFRAWEKNVEISDSGRKWINDYHNNTVNSVSYWIDTVPDLDHYLQDQYQQYFKTKIIAVCGILQPYCDSVSSFPPHSDRNRKLAINWYFDLGGDVETVFYHEQSLIGDTPTHYRYNEIQELERHCFDNNAWYAFEVDRCHSVEGITSRRTFLSIALDDNVDTYDLKSLFEDLNKWSQQQ